MGGRFYVPVQPSVVAVEVSRLQITYVPDKALRVLATLVAE